MKLDFQWMVIKTRYRPLWEVTIAGPPRYPVWCRLVTVPTDPFTTFARPTGPFMSEWDPTRKYPNWRNRTSDLESDRRFWMGFWIEKPGFLFEFPCNHVSISLSFGDIRVWQTNGDRQTDNTDHYYSWLPHCGGPANKQIYHTSVYLNVLRYGHKW